MVAPEKYGVHRTHCCKKHGCKYNSENCPVVLGKIDQDYPCEHCDFEKEEKEQRLAFLGLELLAELKGDEVVFRSVSGTITAEQMMLRLNRRDPVSLLWVSELLRTSRDIIVRGMQS
jgi:hypothetical protein